MFKLFSRKRASRRNERWSLETPLFHWDATRQDSFTLGDAYCGLLCLGRTGSGKSSAIAKRLALSQLAAGFGGLVLTVKPGERQVWEHYCRLTGRTQDLRVVDASCRFRLNFLDELLTEQGTDAGLTENIVALFMELAQAGARHTSKSGGGGGGGGGDGEFFDRAARQMLRNLVDLLILATGRVSVVDLCRLVNTLPRSEEQLASEVWRKGSFCFAMLERADKAQKSPRQQRDYAAVVDYVCGEVVRLADRTFSSIVATFTSMADLFQRGLLADLHGSDTTLSPRAIGEGAILLIDLPLKLYGEAGLLSQLVWKAMAQRYLERRVITPQTRPAFLQIDEAQFFAAQQSDALFATTCRSAKVSYCLLSQSISGFETAFGGGPLGKALSEQLFANLSTKVICALGDAGSAEWASTLVGKSYRYLSNFNGSYAGPDWAMMAGLSGNDPSTAGLTESLQFDVEPREFSFLRTGGPTNDWCVDAIALRSGTPFVATGQMWRPVTFGQK